MATTQRGDDEPEVEEFDDISHSFFHEVEKNRKELKPQQMTRSLVEDFDIHSNNSGFVSKQNKLQSSDKKIPTLKINHQHTNDYQNHL